MRQWVAGIAAHTGNGNHDGSVKAANTNSSKDQAMLLAFLTALYPPFPLPLGLTIRIQLCVMLIRQSWCVLPSAPGQRFH